MTAGKHRQRGWVGLVVLLIALLIVAFLAKDALKQYGALSGAGTRSAAMPADADAPSARAAPPTPIERARGLEETLKRQADEQAKQMP